MERFWDLRRNSSEFTTSIIDSKGGIEATLNNFTDADADFTGLTFDGSSKYIDLSANSINVGGDETIGNGFSFETYVKYHPEQSASIGENTTHSLPNKNIGSLSTYTLLDMIAISRDGNTIASHNIVSKYPFTSISSAFDNIWTASVSLNADGTTMVILYENNMKIYKYNSGNSWI